jgi:hypothetical protein
LKIDAEPPGELAEPIKRLPEDALISPPQSALNVRCSASITFMQRIASARSVTGSLVVVIT